MPRTRQIPAAARRMFQQWGQAGGRARKRSLTAEQRRESARAAGKASAAKRKAKKTKA